MNYGAAQKQPPPRGLTSIVAESLSNEKTVSKQFNSPNYGTPLSQDSQKLSQGLKPEETAAKKDGSLLYGAASKQQDQVRDDSLKFEMGPKLDDSSMSGASGSKLGFVTLEPKFLNGTVIFRKKINLDKVVPLKIWDPEKEILTNIHVHKSGGTSLDEAIVNSTIRDCRMRCATNLMDATRARGYTCVTIPRALCRDHFDWTLVAESQAAGYKMAPIIMMRNPVARAVSHFFYLQSVVGRDDEEAFDDSVLLNYDNIKEFLSDYGVMLHFRRLWFDGSVRIFPVLGRAVKSAAAFYESPCRCYFWLSSWTHRTNAKIGG